MKNILMALLILLLVGCSGRPLEAKRVLRNEQHIQELWRVAQPVKTDKDVEGCWISEGNDLPNNTIFKIYQMNLSRHGTLSASIIYQDGSGLGAPPLIYKIIGSKLCTDAVEVTSVSPDTENIKIYKDLLLMEKSRDITVFRRCSK